MTKLPIRWVKTTVLATACLCLPALAAPTAAARQADFAGHKASVPARVVADWVVDSNDARDKPFVIIDKRDARLYVFDAQGRLQGQTPVLLGLARGDDTVPGIGDKPLAEIKPHERTTPAGRFVAEHGRNHNGDDIVWVDYDSAVSMHRVRAVSAKERRLQRLASPTVADNRISYGCINVPAAFYDAVLLRTVRGVNPIVYVLPETRSVQEVFGAYDVRERQRRASSS